MLVFLSLAGAIAAGFLLLREIASANPASLAHYARVGAGGAAVMCAAIVALRGGIIIATPLAALGIRLLYGSLTALRPTRSSQSDQQTTRSSSIETETLKMQLDLDTGAICGQVLTGRFAGQTLERLTSADLAALWRECQFADPKSARLVEANLDRAYPRWRAERGATESNSAVSEKMTRQVAMQVLGLDSSASENDVRKAHHDLMKKLHPDHGGSVYLASKINEARDVLLGR